MRLIERRINHGGVERVLPLLEVLHDGHDRIGPLVPHIRGRTLRQVRIVAAIREVVAPLREFDINRFQRSYNGIVDR